MNSITVQSPSKINLYLKILSRRKDGYHRMLTIFHRVSLSDRLVFQKNHSGDIRLLCSNKQVPTGEENLIVRAYRLLQSECPRLKGVSIRLTKKIPMQAGLGGGSSNAAATLMSLKKLYGLRVSHARLVSIGKKLGADIPFFLANAKLARGTDRGDVVKKVPFSGKLWFLLVLSNKGLSTKKVFSKLPKRLPQVTLTNANRAAKLCLYFLKAKDLQQLSRVLTNDLEAPAFHLKPSLRGLIENFESEGVQTAQMSGSGATVFAIFKSEREAKRIKQKMQKNWPKKKFVVCSSF